MADEEDLKLRATLVDEMSRPLRDIRREGEAARRSLRDLDRDGRATGRGLDATAGASERLRDRVSHLGSAVRNAAGDARRGVASWAAHAREQARAVTQTAAHTGALSRLSSGLHSGLSGALGAAGSAVSRFGGGLRTMITEGAAASASAMRSAAGAAHTLLSSSLDAAGNAAHRAGRGLALMAGVSARWAAIGLVGLTAASVGFGLKTAASNEQALISFKQLLGTQAQAEAFFDEIKGFAATTPFELDPLRDASARLLAVGLEAGRVIPLMRSLGDATSAMGTGSEGINRAVLALSQMQLKGKVTGEELLQLQEAGIPAIDALAAKLGIDIPAAQALVSAGQVKVNDLFVALETYAGPAMARVKGMMDVQALSLTGLFSTLKDTVSQGLAEAMEPAIPAIKALMPDITDAISGALGAVGPSLGVLVTAVLGALESLLPAVVPIIDLFGQGLGAVFVALAPVAVGLAEPLKAIGAGLVQVLQAVLPLLGPLGILAGSLGTALGQVFFAISPALEDLAVALGELIVAFAPLFPVLGQVISQLLVALLPVITQVVSVIADALAPAIVELAPQFGEVLLALLPIIPSLVELLDALLPIIPPLVEILTLIIKVSSYAQAGLITALVAVAGVITDVLAPVLRVIVDLFDKVWGAATRLAGAVGNALNKIPLIGGLLPGDTPHGRSPRGNLGATLASHRAIDSAIPGRRTITSSVRTWGLGSSTSDHARGSALDLTGTGLGRYAAAATAAGHYAAFHGSGSGRHLHVAYGGRPAVGDTAHARSGGRGAGAGTTQITVAPGAVVVNNPSSTADVAQGVAEGMDQWWSDVEERSNA